MSEAVGDADFELLDLIREEEDPEAAATDCKVSTMYVCSAPKGSYQEHTHCKLKNG